MSDFPLVANTIADVNIALAVARLDALTLVPIRCGSDKFIKAQPLLTDPIWAVLMFSSTDDQFTLTLELGTKRRPELVEPLGELLSRQKLGLYGFVPVSFLPVCGGFFRASITAPKADVIGGHLGLVEMLVTPGLKAVPDLTQSAA